MFDGAMYFTASDANDFFLCGILDLLVEDFLLLFSTAKKKAAIKFLLLRVQH